MVTDSNELLGQALGTCTLQRLLGRGGMGAVYLARQSRPRRIVAVKVLLPGIVEQRPRNEFLARFRREADAVAALDHVHIMPVYEYGEQGDLAYLVMPYVTGGTLREVLEKRGILSLEEVVPIIEQAAAGLDTAHAQGIVHRDLKPGNILFHADGRVLLADFGLAKMLKDVTDQENTNGHLTSIGTIVGTPEYLSPEQGTGDSIDYRTDVYSLGVVLYQMLAGRVPFTGTSPVAVAIKHTLEQPPPITRFNPQVPKNVEAVVMKAMAKSPAERFSSAGVFAQALRQAVAEALGDSFPSVAPPSLGEHITPVLLPPLKIGNEAEIPLEPAANSVTTPNQAVEKAADKEADPQQTMSTMLMQDEKEAAEPTEITPRLSEHTQKRLQAMPTVITEMDATIADHARPEPLAVPLAQSPMRSTTPTADPLAAGHYQETRNAVKPSANIGEHPQQMEAATRQPQVQIYSERPLRTGQRQVGAAMPRYLIFAGAVLAVILVIATAGIIISNQHGNSPQHNPSSITQSSSGTGTAVSVGTPGAGKSVTPAPTNTVHATYPLPAPKIEGMGSLIYGTNYPGNCDPQGAKWQNNNIQAVCGPDNLRLSGPSSSPAGTILTQLPNGQSLPDSYYIQAQVTLNTPGSQFGFYYHYKSDGGYYTILFSSTDWTASYTDKNGAPSQLATVGIHGTQLDDTAIIDILVQGDSFIYYVNGVQQGTASGNFGDSNSGGNIGLTVASGSDVSFKNVAIYSA